MHASLASGERPRRLRVQSLAARLWQVAGVRTGAMERSAASSCISATGSLHPASPPPPAPRAPPAAPPGVVDVCLIPEIRFELDRLCDFVHSILERKDYCVVCVAEGARRGWGGVRRVRGGRRGRGVAGRFTCAWRTASGARLCLPTVRQPAL